MRGSSGRQCGAAPSPSFLDEPHPASTPRGAPLGIVSGSLSAFDRCLGFLACWCPRRIYVQISPEQWGILQRMGCRLSSRNS